MSRIMKQRLGITGWKGSTPFHPFSKTITTTTYGEGHNPGVTTGAVFHLPVNNWNDPIGDLATLIAGTGTLIHNRHPMDHDTAVLFLYNVAQVLSWKAVIDINQITAETPLVDFFVAYTFVQSEGTQVILSTTPATARIERLNIFTNPRWTVVHFDGTSVKRKGMNKPIVISVPNVFEYCRIISQGQSANDTFGQAVMSHAIADVNHTVNPPVIKLFCNVVIASEAGVAMDADSLHVTVAITQKVRVFRAHSVSKDLSEGVPDTHA